MGGLDLSGVQSLVEGWMVDRLRITRDHGEADDELDLETGLLSGPGAVEVYDGDGLIQSISGFSAMPDPDVQRIVEETGADYRVLLPLAAQVGFVVGDLLQVREIHAPVSDPRLLTLRFTVVDLGGASTYSVARILYLRQVPTLADPPPAPETTTPDMATLAATDLYGNAVWDGTTLTGATMILTGGLVVDPTVAYTMEVDYQVTNVEFGGHASIHSVLPGDVIDGASYEELAVQSPAYGSTNLTLEIGPGLMGWDAQVVAAGERNLALQFYALDITSIVFTPALEPGP